MHLIKKSSSNNNLIKHLLLAGTGFKAQSISAYIENHPECGLRITGFLTDKDDEIGKKISNKKILGKAEDLIQIVHNNYTDCVVYTEELEDTRCHKVLLQGCSVMGIDFATTQEEFHDKAVGKKRIFSERIGNIELKIKKFVYVTPQASFSKRVFDLIFSLMLITLFLPFFVVVPILIKLTSHGPVFFRQERIGKYGKRFILFKFRSMVQDAENMQEKFLYLNEMDGPAFKIEHDPRQTKIGKILRKTSFDELPQLFNVVKGDISLVGPRPAIENEVIQYSPVDRKRLSMIQGITCIWQISGRNRVKFDEWMKLDLNYFTGICLNNIGDFQGAMESFKIIHETEPWNIPNKLKMAIIFNNMEMWSNAEEIHRSILEKNPKFADIHFHLGLCLMGQGKTSEAAESFKKALHINPSYIDARIKLGIAQACIGQYEDAFTNLNSVIDSKPEYADVYYMIGIIKEECNAAKEAVKYLQKATRISPRFKNAQVKLIICYCQLGDMDSAQTQIKEALKFYPDDKRLKSLEKYLTVFESSSNQINDISMEIKNILGSGYSIRELRNEFHNGLDIMPNFSEIIAMFSSRKYAQQDSTISEFLISIISEQIEKNPTYPDLYNSLGLQLSSNNKNLEAENAFVKAVELNPEYVTARINLFKILQKVGKHEQAYEHGKFLLSKNLPFPDIYYTMVKVLIDLKLFDEALINAKRVLKLRPSMGDTHLLLAHIYENLNDYDAAIKAVKKCLTPETEFKLAADAEKMLKKLKKKR